MTSYQLKQKYNRWEIKQIEQYFAFKSNGMSEVSLRPLKILVKRLDTYYNDEVNLSQNTNLNISAFSSNIVSATIALERIAKGYSKDKVTVEERYEFELKKIVTYVFFTDDEGNIVDVKSYVKRLKETLLFLISFFETNRKMEGTIAYANCKRFYTHLSTIYTFIHNLLNVFLDRPIK